MKRKPEMESGLDPEKSPGLASPAALEEGVPLPETPAGRVHLAMQIAKALVHLDILEDRCRYGGSVGLADLRKAISLLRGEQ